MISNSIKRLTIKTALAGKGTGPRLNFRLGAVLFKKKQIVNAKTNTGKPAIILKEFTSFPLLHAETCCITAAGFDNCSGLDLAVSRVLRDGSVSMARPCNTCLAVIRHVGIRRVYYTDWLGEWQCEKI